MRCLLSKAAASWSLRHIYFTFFVGVEGLEESWWNDVSLNKTFLCLSSLSIHDYKYRLMSKGRVGFWLLSQIDSLVIFTSCKLQQKKYIFTNAELFYNLIVVMLAHYHHSALSSGVNLNPLLWSPDPCLNENNASLPFPKVILIFAQPLLPCGSIAKRIVSLLASTLLLFSVFPPRPCYGIWAFLCHPYVAPPVPFLSSPHRIAGAGSIDLSDFIRSLLQLNELQDWTTHPANRSYSQITYFSEPVMV